MLKTSQLALSLMLITRIHVKRGFKNWTLICKYFSGRQDSRVKNLVVVESNIGVSLNSQSQMLEGEG